MITACLALAAIPVMWAMTIGGVSVLAFADCPGRHRAGGAA